MIYREMSEKVKGEEDVEHFSNIVIPKDEYEWNKYGQKLIKKIGNKYRSYFKCKKKDCGAKKKVEWAPTKPSYVRVLYDGSHNHQRPIINYSDQVYRYDLANQIFGSRN